MIAPVIAIAVKTPSTNNSFPSSTNDASRNMMPRISLMKCVFGKTSPMYCASLGMPSKGNMNPDNSMDGINTKTVNCIA